MAWNNRVRNSAGAPAFRTEITVGFDQPDFSKLAAAKIFVADFEVQRIAPALRVHLDDAIVAARGGNERLALDHVNADGLFQIDVRAGFHGGDGGQRVPVVGCGDDDDVVFAGA